MLASFACIPSKSRGRLNFESDIPPIYSNFELDKSRIIESTAFRRLEYKTQVFVNHEGDHYRNRLTHSLEAALIARIISNSLKASADLAETLTLAHDLGHAPFGHAGEAALNEEMQKFGEEFDHNSHTIKILTKLENKFPQFNGLNLTIETLEGIAKHNGPLLNPSKIIAAYSAKQDLDLKNYSSIEAQISSSADDIAYNNHDIDDGFRAGLLSIKQLSDIDKLASLIDQIKFKYPNLEEGQLVHLAVQQMKNMMMIDLIETTKSNLKNFSIKTQEDVRLLKKPIVEFSNEMELYHQQIKKFLMNKVYTHYSVSRMSNKAKRMIRELFNLYMNDINCLPTNWRVERQASDKDKAIIVCDFIACMTDRHAIAEYRSFFS